MKEGLSRKKEQPRRGGVREKKTLGPVPNLEEHVHPDWWRRIFNSIYLKTDADVVDDQNTTKKEVDYFSPSCSTTPSGVTVVARVVTRLTVPTA